MDEESTEFVCSECGAEVSEENVCPQCGSAFEQTEVEPLRMGGWLVGLAVDLAAALFLLLSVAFDGLESVMNHTTWAAVATPGAQIYHPLFAPLLILEFAGGLLLSLWLMEILVLFFQKKAIVPKMLIAFFVVHGLFVLLHYVLAGKIPYLAQHGDPGATRTLIRTVLGCAIWIPYLLRSERVKLTFLR